MKKTFALTAAVMTMGISAYAANPFSDVSADDWAYQAVADLSDQGIVEGYPDGMFRGEKNITRYELAEIIARLMSKEDQLNASQKATLDKLAGEYADELANLGVRVSNLEKKVGQISWSGDARMRYLSDPTMDKKTGTKTGDVWDGRIRLNVKGKVNKDTYVKGRFLTNMYFKNGKSDDGSTTMDQLFVNHSFGKAEVRLGRQPIVIGNQKGWLYGKAIGFDGARLSYGEGNWNGSLSYGQFNGGWNEVKGKDALEGADFFAAQAGYTTSSFKAHADYLKFASTTNQVDNPEIYGGGIDIPLGQSRFDIFGDYYKNSSAKSDYDTGWNAGIGYGTMKAKKPGTFRLSLAYMNVDREVYFGGTILQTNYLNNLADSFGTTKNSSKYKADSLKFWNLMGDVSLMKNVYLHGEYAFAGSATHGEDPDDGWTLSLNYKF
ncbi:S-layer homology domain-containing protein [uncultured Dialister sp.]|uniref:S-layer homology domain-containing protein n=1 Tax=uncultured Dialister sp. TaxID=278064 RepID=UPI002623C970|nr:S-layer homology domain-containing protein [uncultured Dialister sp.]